MKKGVISLILVLALFILPLVLAEGIDDELQKLTHYAEEYETGNIDYVQLLVYSGSIREKLNQEFGAISREHGGILKQEQIRKMLGEPTEMTRWVWVPKVEHERKVLNPIPVWRKIIFDGRKIQIGLEAFPMVFVKGRDFEKENGGFGGIEEEVIVYSLHFDIRFKKPEEELNIKGKIEEVKGIAEKYYADPSEGNLEELAKKSVNVEMGLEPVLKQSGDKCENIMNSIFGSENSRGTFESIEKMVDFYSRDNFEVMVRLEKSREWVGLDFWIEGRGRGFKMSDFGFDEKGKGFTGGVIQAFEKITGFAVGDEEEPCPDVPEPDYDREHCSIEPTYDDGGCLSGYSAPICDDSGGGGGGEGDGGSEPDNNCRDKWKACGDPCPPCDYEKGQGDEGEWRGEFEEFDDRKDDFKDDKFEDKKEFDRKGRFSDVSVEEIKGKIETKVGELKTAFEIGDYKKFRPLTDEIRELGQTLNEASNEKVWMGLENEQMNNMNNEGENHEPYFWIKQRVEMEEKKNQLMEQNGNEIYDFYSRLFSGMTMTESFSERQEWELRLYQSFRESGKEICDNDVDDNNNDMKDCEDSQCGGKFAGSQTVNVEEDGVIVEKKVDLYCIDGRPQPKKEEKKKEAVCGNHILDVGESCGLPEELEGEELEKWKEENKYCPEDCVKCPEHKAIECLGEVIFKGEDENGCPLEPVCLETESCVVNDDCDFRCGIGECVYEHKADETGKCKLVELTECVTSDCEGGDTEESLCDNGDKIVIRVCSDDGKWVDLHTECPQKTSDNVCCSEPGEDDRYIYRWRSKEECSSPPGAEFGVKIVGDSNCQEKIEKPKPIVGEECVLANDCGGGRVCSNGKCVKLPEKIEGIDCAVLLCKEGFDCIQDVGCKPIPGYVFSKKPEEVEGVEEHVEEVEEETESENEKESEEGGEGVTGNVIFNFIIGLFTRPRITGAVTGFEVAEGGGEPESAPEPQPEPIPEPPQEEPVLESPPEEGNGDGGGEDSGPGPEPDNNCRDKWKACGDPCPPCDYEKGRGDEDDRHEDFEKDWKEEDWKERDREERGKGCGNEAQEKCKEVLMSPCIDECMFPRGGGEQGDFNECQSKCEGKVEIGGCVSKYVELCKEDKWDEWGDYERGLWGENEHQEEKEVFMANGMCSKNAMQKTGTEGNIHFGGWGELTDKVMRAKNRYYAREGDWCKEELKNLIKQRGEIEKSFNQEFAVWFFEEYLANSAEDWEQSMSGIYELYWNNVDNSMRAVEMMNCAGKSDIDELMNYNLINIEYESEYGRMEYWEEIKEVKMPGSDEKIKVISPYMRLWIFPPKEFIIYEMKKAMKEHEFPGPPEESMKRENEEGLTDEERVLIKRDRQFMEKIRAAVSAYGGNIDAVVQFKDYETDDIVFNLYIQVNEDVIMEMKPMPPEEVPAEDVRIVIDFKEIYEMIEKSMKGEGERIESPPWDRKAQPIQRVKEVVNGVQMFFKVRKILNDAEIIPAESEKEVRDLFNLFFKMMMRGDDRGPRDGEDKGEDVFKFKGEEDRDNFKEGSEGEFNEEKGGGLFGLFGGGDKGPRDKEFSDEDLERMREEMGDEKFERMMEEGGPMGGPQGGSGMGGDDFRR